MNKEDLSQFIQFCETPYHFISYSKELLNKLGYTELYEEDEWNELPTKGFVIRQSGAIIAYKYDSLESVLITTSRYDSSDRFLSSSYVSKLDKYDRDFIETHQRPLKCAGYVIVRSNNSAKNILFDSGDESISFFTDINEDMYDSPDYSSILLPYLSKKLNVNENDILDFRLHFIDPQMPSILPDNTVSSYNMKFNATAFSSLQAFIQAEPKNQMNIFCAFYNEDELDFYRSPTIFDDFLTSFIDKVFCFDFQKNYLKNSFCICLEGFECQKTENDHSCFNQVHLLQSSVNFENEKKSEEKEFSKDFPIQKVDFLLSDSTIKRELYIQACTLGIPISSIDDKKKNCSYDSISKLFDILKQVLTEFH